MSKRPVLLIACGALAHEVTAIMAASGWDGLTVQCLPAKLHNRPALIPREMRAKIAEERDNFERIFALYGDCGTGGELDTVLAEEGVERIEGAHCYEFFATTPVFEKIADDEPCTYYLTDFLVRHFDKLVMEGLGLHKHPELLPMYFGNYKRVLYLAQVPTEERIAEARAAADKLGLAFEMRITGYGALETTINALIPAEIDRQAAE